MRNGLIIETDGTQIWWLNDRWHRADGPALIFLDGTQIWVQNGDRHREDGPAYMRSDGTQSWWVHGVRDRKDGPAIIDSDGYQQWYLNGRQIVGVEEWIERLGLKPWQEWGEFEKMLFRVSF